MALLAPPSTATALRLSELATLTGAVYFVEEAVGVVPSEV
jgi:hypothetical protein